MNIRSRYDFAIEEWNASTRGLKVAIADVMNDGMQTDGGTWIVTMNQAKATKLRAARERAESARQALDRVLDDVLEPETVSFQH